VKTKLTKYLKLSIRSLRAIDSWLNAWVCKLIRALYFND
jgi:hypothetical protein